MLTNHKGIWVWTSFAVFLIGALWQSPTQAQAKNAKSEKNGPSAEKLLPGDALLYVGWDGVSAHRSAWEKTAAYEAIVKSGLSEMLLRMRNAVQQRGAQAGVPAEEIGAAIEHLWSAGFSLAVAAPAAGQGPPQPQLTVVVPGGAMAIPQLTQLLSQIGPAQVETAEDGPFTVSRLTTPMFPGIDVGWFAQGQYLVLAVGTGAVDAALNVASGRAPALATNAVWKKYSAKAEFESALTAWIDLASIRQFVAGIPVGRGDAGQPATVEDILKMIGLERIGPVAYRLGLKGKSLWSETTIEAPAPRTGLLAFADGKPLSLPELPPLPAGTDGFYAARLDWSSASSSMLKIGGQLSRLLASPDSPPVDALLARAQQELGFDFQKDLFDTLGDTFALYGDTRQGMFGMGIGLVVSVKDVKVLRRTLDKLLTRLAQDAGPNVRIQGLRKLGRTVNVIELPELPLFSPSITLDDKWLIVGLYPQTVEAFLLRLDGKMERWTPPAEITSALTELGAKFSSATVSDPREGLRTAVGLAPILAGTLQARMRQPGPFGQPQAELAEPIFSFASLPPTELITRPLFLNVSICTPSDSGIRWTSRTSLPSVPFLGGAGIGSAGAATPVLVALLLPAVQQAREAARRSQSKNNLKMIGLALHNYHDTFNGFPAGTHPNEDLKPEERLSWHVDLLPYLDQAQLFNQIDFDAAWDAESNARVLALPVPTLLNPGLSVDPRSKYGLTHYVGLAGLGKDGPMRKVGDPKAGFFAYDRVTRIQDITDGTSNTIAVAEASKDLGAWGAGGRATIRALTQKPYINGPDGLGGVFRGGVQVLFADGRVQFISENIDPAVMEALTTIAGGEAVGAP